MTKILLQNVGYFRGIDGSVKSFLRHVFRFLYVSTHAQRMNIERFLAVIQEENPDLVLVNEIDQGSIDTGNLNQVDIVRESIGHGFSVTKYDPRSTFHRIWFLGRKANAVFSKIAIPVTHAYFSRGIKRLLLTTRINNVSVYLVHLALIRRKVRAAQIKELAQIVKSSRGDVLVCGDFNIHRGDRELQPLFDAGLASLDTGATFPSSRPKLMLDRCLVSSAIANRVRVRVLQGHDFSDHLPVMIELIDEV